MMYKSLLVIFVCCFSIEMLAANPNPNVTYENLVFEGGGIRGIAYCGVVSELEEMDILTNIKRVGGTSAGAINALLLALGYTATEMQTMIYQTDFQQFNDNKYGFFSGISNMTKRFGWYKTTAFETWLADCIAHKVNDSNLTFSDLHQLSLTNSQFKDLYVTGTDLSQQSVLVFSYETYPDMLLKDAIRVSMSVPLYFEAAFIDERGKLMERPSEGSVVVDGGILANYPITIFDASRYCSSGKGDCLQNGQSQTTLGIRLDEAVQIDYDQKGKGLAPANISSIKTYIVAFYNIILENLNRQLLTSFDWQRSISVSTAGIGPKVKALSDAEKNLLIESGKSGVEAFFRKN